MATLSSFDRVALGDSQFESWARALCQFVIRALILPVTLILAKPRDLLRAVESGEYRPLPSPFLLALITGIVLSGVTSNLPMLFNTVADENGRLLNDKFFESVLGFYTEINAVETILFAVPYILFLWLFAGLISFCMWRGIRTAEALMVALSLSLSALIELVIVATGVGLLFANLFHVDPTQSLRGEQSQEMTTIILSLAGALFLYTLVLTFKLIRLLFVIRKERGSPLAGAIVAIFPLLVMMSIAGIIGMASAAAGPLMVRQAATLQAIHNQQQEYQRELARLQALTDMKDDASLALRQRDYARAVAGYDQAAAQEESSSNYNNACWARAVWGEQLSRALEDCNKAIQLESTNRFAMDSRALVHLKLGDLAAALADYQAAYDANETYAHALYGRGIVRLWLGQADEGRADLRRALTRDSTLADTFARYGVQEIRAESSLRGALPDSAGEAPEDPRATFLPAEAQGGAPIPAVAVP